VWALALVCLGILVLCISLLLTMSRTSRQQTQQTTIERQQTVEMMQSSMTQMSELVTQFRGLAQTMVFGPLSQANPTTEQATTPTTTERLTPYDADSGLLPLDVEAAAAREAEEDRLLASQRERLRSENDTLRAITERMASEIQGMGGDLSSVLHAPIRNGNSPPPPSPPWEQGSLLDEETP
jgi:hypothetical protein